MGIFSKSLVNLWFGQNFQIFSQFVLLENRPKYSV